MPPPVDQGGENMPRASYQYGTSPRKYEPEYTPRKISKKTTNKKATNKKQAKEETKKAEAKKRSENQKTKKAKERKSQAFQVIIVVAIFGMLLALSYREITIMEMFNQKKDLESQLATIQKENGQIEKSIREEESKLNWNEIKTKASEQLGMQVKTAIPVDLEKSDNVEIKSEFIKEEKTDIIEEIIEYFINKTCKN